MVEGSIESTVAGTLEVTVEGTASWLHARRGEPTLATAIEEVEGAVEKRREQSRGRPSGKPRKR